MTLSAFNVAEAQLRDLAEASGGAIQILAGPIPAIYRGYMSFDVSLDVHDLPHTADGIRVRPREVFRIAVSAQFPFIAPIVDVPHLRWAGTPHVQWGQRLCLYLSPALEWSPQDGMRGLIERILIWLERAATATLDPAGQPPHPPIAYVTPDADFAVIHADIGPLAADWAAKVTSTGPDTLVGWGVRRGKRLDLYHWLTPADFDRHFEESTLPALSEGQATAAICILLAGEIAFEYPSDPIALAKGLARAGLTHDAFRDVLQRVANATSAYTPKAPRTGLPPVQIFIGSPSRSIDGHTPLTHLLGFTMDLRGPGLDMLFQTLSGRPTTLTPHSAGEGSATLSWLTIYENRPEVTQRRDRDSPLTWVSGKRVLVLGAGALGAPIAEHCVRGGAAQVTVADSGRVNPGILVRQPYYDADIGEFKAAALAGRLNGIRTGPVVDALTDDVITALFTGGKRAPDYNLIIDATANAGVRSAIEAARAVARATWPPVITALIGHTAEAGLVTVSATSATGAGHDVLRRTGIAARRHGSGWDDIAAEFFPHPPRADAFFPEPGCSEPTFTGSAADVNALAGSMLATALEVVAGSGHKPMTSIAIRTPAAALREPDGSLAVVTTLGWPNDYVAGESSGVFEVRVSRAALAEMRAEARRRARLHRGRVETGGMILGSVDDAARCVYIDHASPPTPDSLLAEHHFEHGVDGAQRTVDYYRDATGNVTGFIGMWHTHPFGSAHPSKTDEQGMASLVIPVAGGGRALMLIVGGEARDWLAWRDGQSEPRIYARYLRRTSVTGTGAQRSRPPGNYIRAGYTPAVGSHDVRRRRLGRLAALAHRIGRRRR